MNPCYDSEDFIAGIANEALYLGCIEAKVLLLPESLDDCVSDSNLVRVVNVFVDVFDLVIPSGTSRSDFCLPCHVEKLLLRLCHPYPAELTLWSGMLERLLCCRSFSGEG